MENASFGFCKRHAPDYDSELKLPRWPPVDDTDWCGDWEPK